MKAALQQFYGRLPAWVLVVVLFFGAVYARSLTFVYIEGDDAASVAFHAMGRDRSLQQPFNEYHSGMDMLLGVLPADEGVLRISFMVLTALAAVMMVLLMLAVAFMMIGGLGEGEKSFVALALLLSVPEFFYLGLAYMPTLIAMCFALAGHLVLKPVFNDGGASESASWRVPVSAALLGLGAACRWDMALYGWVVAADAIFTAGPGGRLASGLSKRAALIAVFGILAATFWLVLLKVSGYGFGDTIKTLRSTGSIASEGRFTWIISIVHWLGVWTPAFVMLTAWGAYRLFKADRAIFLKAAVFSVPIFLIFAATKWPPKQVMMFFPGLVLMLVAGASGVYRLLSQPGLPKAAALCVIAVILLPWFVGIRATYADTAWGPGFEFREYDRQESGNSARPALFTGGAIPTQEGPRGLWGHAGVFLGGAWRKHVTQVENERLNVIAKALELKLPIICLQGGCQYIEAELSGMGFITKVPSWRLSKHGLYLKRVFFNTGGRTLPLLISQGPASALLRDRALLKEVMMMAGGTMAVALGGDPSAARLIYLSHPDSMTKIGNMSALLDLAQLE
jgi:hypothetical protein